MADCSKCPYIYYVPEIYNSDMYVVQSMDMKVK